MLPISVLYSVPYTFLGNSLAPLPWIVVASLLALAIGVRKVVTTGEEA